MVSNRVLFGTVSDLLILFRDKQNIYQTVHDHLRDTQTKMIQQRWKDILSFLANKL